MSYRAALLRDNADKPGSMRYIYTYRRDNVSKTLFHVRILARCHLEPVRVRATPNTHASLSAFAEPYAVTLSSRSRSLCPLFFAVSPLSSSGTCRKFQRFILSLSTEKYQIRFLVSRSSDTLIPRRPHRCRDFLLPSLLFFSRDLRESEYNRQQAIDLPFYKKLSLIEKRRGS